MLGAGARQAHGLEGAQPDLVGAKRQMRRGAVPEKVLLQALGWGSGRPESRESAGQARGSVHAAPPARGVKPDAVPGQPWGRGWHPGFLIEGKLLLCGSHSTKARKPSCTEPSGSNVSPA